MASIPSDLAISQAPSAKSILDVAASIGLRPQDLITYGDYRANVTLSVLDRQDVMARPKGRYIDVTAITDPARRRQDDGRGGPHPGPGPAG